MTISVNQVYTVSDNLNDLTGMYVVSDKPIAVLSAVSHTYGIPVAPTADPAAVFLPPISALGFIYILPPIAGRSAAAGYYAHVVAAYDNTFVTGVFAEPCYGHVLQRGQKRLLLMNSPYPTTVTCSKRCLVVLYNKASGVDNRDTDTFAMYVPSISQTISSVQFNTFLGPGDQTFKYVPP